MGLDFRICFVKMLSSNIALIKVTSRVVGNFGQQQEGRLKILLSSQKLAVLMKKFTLFENLTQTKETVDQRSLNSCYDDGNTGLLRHIFVHRNYIRRFGRRYQFKVRHSELILHLIYVLNIV